MFVFWVNTEDGRVATYDQLDGAGLVEDEKPYREWCVPAELINEHAVVTLMSDGDLDQLSEQRWLSRRGQR